MEVNPFLNQNLSCDSLDNAVNGLWGQVPFPIRTILPQCLEEVASSHSPKTSNQSSSEVLKSDLPMSVYATVRIISRYLKYIRRNRDKTGRKWDAKNFVPSCSGIKIMLNEVWFEWVLGI